jgi:CelD/BcsL family acetyltransferase involved in cellulose biosynthesis
VTSPIQLERRVDHEELDAFLATAHGGSYYHGSAWLSILAEVYGLRLAWLVVREAGALRALLPFAESRRFGLVHRQSLPFGTYGGPALAPDADPALADHLCEHFLATGGAGSRVTLTLPPDPARPEPVPGAETLATQILDLSPGWDTLFADAFRKEKRRQARKSMREGVVVARSFDPADVDAYYPIYLEHVREWKLAEPTPVEHLKALLADEAGVCFWVARREGEILGAHFNLHHRGAVVAWHGTTRRAHSRLAPSVLLYAMNLEDACARGERSFNFGGSGAKDPLFEYKAAFGAQPVHYAQRRREGALYGLLRRVKGGAR